MNSIKKKEAPQIIEFAIYKHAPLSGFVHSILLWLGMFFAFRILDWAHGKTPVSLRISIMGGILAGCILYLPTYLSALLMNRMQKPILRFTKNGFYYTPQIWSNGKWYRWETIHDIQMGYAGDDHLAMKVYLSDGEQVLIDQTILPIDLKKLLTIFECCLKNG